MLLFPDLIAQIRPLTEKPIHVHLMIADNALMDQIDQFAEAGADIISIHAENADIETALDQIATRGIVPGLVLQLHTAVASVQPHLGRLGMVTLLGTQMGIKGVGLDAQAEDRLREARRLIDETGSQPLLAADGGIREHTVPGLRKAGADTIVMGSLALVPTIWQTACPGCIPCRGQADMPAEAVIAVDIGGTQIRVALFENKRIQQRAAMPTDVKGGPSGVMDQINALIQQVSTAHERKGCWHRLVTCRTNRH